MADVNHFTTLPINNMTLSYIGQTGRTITHRLKEHKQALTSPYHFSAVAEHAMKECHVNDWKSGKVIDICHQLYPRCYLESWYIKTKVQ